MTDNIAVEESTPRMTDMDYDANASGYFNNSLHSLFDLTTTIDMYALPVILTFGFPANIVAILVFSIKSFRQASCGLYLIGKSVADTVFLVCTFIVWLERVNVRVLHNPGVCQLVLYLTYIGACVSVWFVVALTLENLIRIRYPFRVGSFCTLKVAKRCILVTAASAVVLYCPVLWLNHVTLVHGYPACQMDEAMRLLNSIYTYLDTIVTLILPSVTILVMLFLTTEAVWMSKARNRRMYNAPKLSTSIVMQQQITRMLSAVSVSFIVMALPSHIARVSLLVITWISQPDISPEQYMVQHLLQLLYYLTFSVNIITYIIFSNKFRLTICGCFSILPRFRTNSSRMLAVRSTNQESKVREKTPSKRAEAEAV